MSIKKSDVNMVVKPKSPDSTLKTPFKPAALALNNMFSSDKETYGRNEDLVKQEIKQYKEVIHKKIN